MPGVDAQAVMQTLQQVPRRETQITPSDWSFQGTVMNQKDLFAEFQVETAHRIVPGRPIDIHVPAHETFQTSGNGNQETFNLSYDLVDAPAVVDDVVLYSDGNAASEDSLDYDADSFDYTDGGTVEDLDVFYLVSDQAEITLRLQDPKNFQNEPISVEGGRLNLRDQGRDPVTFEPSQPLEGVIPTDYNLEWYINAGYSFAYEGNQTGATADNLMLHLPVYRASQEVQGLRELKRMAFR